MWRIVVSVSHYIVGAVVTKGALMAITVLGVLHSDGLSTFEKALIIASVSATVTGVFTCFAAVLAVRLNRPVQRDVKKIKEAVVEHDDSPKD